MKFRKKPIVIDAVQWTGNNIEEIQEFTGIPLMPLDRQNHLLIPTLESPHEASINDWIIKGIKGEFYPCKPDIFEETYEEVQ